jgi:hypothetical protein
MSISLSLSSIFKKIRLKKVFALSLLFFILFNSMGYYILFELDKLIVRKEMNARISGTSSNLICLKIEKGEQNQSFHRLGDREIEYSGRLYDVFREIDKGDTILIFCIPDTKEEQLYAGLKRINHNNQRSSLWDHLVKIALAEEPKNLMFITPDIRKFPLLKIHFLSAILPTWSPPPKFS